MEVLHTALEIFGCLFLWLIVAAVVHIRKMVRAVDEADIG